MVAGRRTSGHAAHAVAVEISCRVVLREISNYLDGDLDADLRARIATHVARCRHCRAVLEGACNTLRLVVGGKGFDLPHGFAERLRRRMCIVPRVICGRP